jgi:carboxymethylenebutenolidase
MIGLVPSVATMLHFGELDHAIPLGEVAEVAAAHPDVAVHVYPGAEHGFHCDARTSFHPVAARLAFDRTLGFLVRSGVVA